MRLEDDMRSNFLTTVLAVSVFAAAFLLGPCAHPVTAQMVKGSISGSVIDPSGAAVPDARITLANKETGSVSSSVSDAAGLFHIALLPIGTYSLDVTKEGFRKLTLTQVEVNSSQDTGLGALKLEVGQVTATVEVSGAPALIEATQAQVNTAIQGELLQAFPGIGENEGLDYLALQMPGVVMGRDLSMSNSNGVDFAVNGIRARNNDQQIDGQNNNDNSVAGPYIFVSDSNFVQEYSVTTNNFGAEYGRNSGSVVNLVTKSGTNNWHGAIYGTEGNSALNSLTNTNIAFEGLTKVPHFNDEFAGGVIGGPLKKDKFFVFGGFSQELVTGSKSLYASTGSTPTPTGLGELAACFPTSTSVAALRTYGPYGIGAGNPVPQSNVSTAMITEVDGVTQCGVQVAGVQRTLDTGSHQYNAVLRFDGQGQSDHVTGRWIYQWLNFFNVDPGSGYAGAGYFFNEPSLGEDFGIDWSHTISSKQVNDFRLSYGRLTVEFGGNSYGNTIPTQQQFPTGLTNVDFLDPSIQSFGPPTTFPSGRIVNTYQLQDNWSYFKGRHTIKAGVNFTYQRSPNIFLPNLNGSFQFPDYNTFALNTPQQVNISLGNPNLDFREKDLFLYVADDFKVRPNLTLNLGLTWSYFTQASNLFNQQDLKQQTGPNPFWNPNLPLSVTVLPQIPTSKNNFGPSIGLAYTPNWGGKWTAGKTVLRGGFRIAYDPSFYNIYLNIASSAPQVLANTIPGTLSGGLPAAPFGPAVRSQLSPFLTLGVFDPRSFNQTNVSPNFRPDRAYEWSFGVQREITQHLVAEARYVGNHGSDLFQSINANPQISEITSVFPNEFPGYTACPAAQAVVPTAVGRINCNEGVIRQRTNTAYSNYDGLQLELRGTNIKNQLTLRTAYTYSHTLSNADEIFATFAGGGSIAFSQNPLNYTTGEYSNSGLDFPNNWTLGAVWNIPAYRDQRGVLGKILGGWGMSAAYLIGSGQPYSATQIFLNQTYYDAPFMGGFNSGVEGLRPFAGSPSAPASAVGIYAADACSNLGFSAACSMANNTLLSLNAINASGTATTVNTTQVRFITNAPFADSLYGTPYGNVGRNTLRDYHTNTANFQFFRNVKVTERLNVNAYVSFINLFNHPNFYSIDPFVDDAGITSLEGTGFALPSQFSGSGTNGTPSTIGQRQIHFGVKVIF
jgi:Carboxypeptidase regulatory-like domain